MSSNSGDLLVPAPPSSSNVYVNTKQAPFSAGPKRKRHYREGDDAVKTKKVEFLR